MTSFWSSREFDYHFFQSFRETRKRRKRSKPLHLMAGAEEKFSFLHVAIFSFSDELVYLQELRMQHFSHHQQMWTSSLFIVALLYWNSEITSVQFVFACLLVFCHSDVYIHRRTSRGSEGGCSPPATKITCFFRAKRLWFGQRHLREHITK